jgi:nicotinamide mononucleotide transporter
MDVIKLSDLFLKQLQETSALEWTGIVSTVACIYLAAKEHILNWPVSIIACGAYAVLYYQFRLYGDSYLQIYFLLTAVYGWIFWTSKKDNQEKPVLSLSFKEMLYTLAAIVILTFVLSKYLDNFTDTDVPYADGCCTAISFVAQFLMTRKILQSWVLWIIVDILYVPLLFYKALLPTSILYAFLVPLAAKGYLDWKKSWQLTQ